MEESIEILKYPIGRFEPVSVFAESPLEVWTDSIRTLPLLLERCIENLSKDQLDMPYRPGGWTVRQVVHHIADSHMNAYVRLKLALTGEQPTIAPYDENLWAELPDVFLVPVEVSVHLVRALHTRWSAVLQQMKAEDWLRTYYHPADQKQVALWQMTGMYSWHGRHHVEQILSLRRRMNW